MSQQPNCKKFNLETPATYRIRVQGSIDSTWSDMLGSMEYSFQSISRRLPFVSRNYHPRVFC